MNSTIDVDLAEGTWALSSALNADLSISQPGNNLVFSPFSLTAVLLMAKLGARGKTAQEIDQVLRLPSGTSHDVIVKAINQSLELFKEDQHENITLAAANRIYTRNQLKLHPEFRRNLWKGFRLTARSLNFSHNIKAAARINKWVKYVTKGKIGKLLSPDSVGPSTSLVLVNGVYFKGFWEHGFPAQLTRKESFYVDPSSKVAVDMMHTTGPFLYAEFDEMDAKVVALPYKGNHLSMIIYVPLSVTGLAEVQEWLQTLELPEIFQRFTQGSSVYVSLPKFRIESALQLVEQLEQVGLETMFSSSADFSGMTRYGRRKPFVSNVLHKVHIEVNEDGTESPSVTAFVLNRRSAGFEADFSIKANRPFCFQIVDHRSNLVLFSGVVSNPKEMLE